MPSKITDTETSNERSSCEIIRSLLQSGKVGRTKITGKAISVVIGKKNCRKAAAPYTTINPQTARHRGSAAGSPARTRTSTQMDLRPLVGSTSGSPSPEYSPPTAPTTLSTSAAPARIFPANGPDNHVRQRVAGSHRRRRLARRGDGLGTGH